MKITAGHQPKSDHIARLAVHFSLDRWPDKICACACNNLIITTCKKCRVIKMATSTRKRKTAVGSSSSGASKTKQSKRKVSKDTFQKWQRTYEKEHQSMTWLRAEMDGQDKSLVSTLWCAICRQYENMRAQKLLPGMD